MKDKTLDLELGNAAIKAIGLGKSGESAINHMSANKLKSVTLYPRADADMNAQINDADLLFLIFDEQDSNALNDFMQIAKISNESNILTIALIKTEQSNDIDALKEVVDSFILLPESSVDLFNQYIFDVIQSVTEAIMQQGLIGFDFADFKTLTKRAGRCAIGSGTAAGDKRDIKATEEAIASSLLKAINFKDINGIFINISAVDQSISEFNTICSLLDEVISGNTITKVAVTMDEALGNEIKVSIFCTGINELIKR